MKRLNANASETTHLPVLGFVHTLRVGSCKAALTVKGRDGSAELGHGVQIRGEVVQHSDDVRRECRPLCPLFRNPVHLANKSVRGYTHI